MAHPNFFNENINRTFPFQVGTAGLDPQTPDVTVMQTLPDALIADCGFVLGPEAGFVEGRDLVYLYRVALDEEDPDIVILEFRAEVRTKNGYLTITTLHSLLFTRHRLDPDYTLEFSESVPDTECGEPHLSGYLVTGMTASLFSWAEELTGQVRVTEQTTLVEPALIQNLSGNQVVSLSLANADRTRAARASKCAPYTWEDFDTGEIYVNRECLQGDLRLRAGYNVAISQSSLTNTIQFSAIPKAGLGEPCGEVKLFADETPPVGATNNLLAGDFYCNEVLRSINGLQGPTLTLFAGTGVAIFADNLNGAVVVDVNLIDLSLCTYSTVSQAI